MTAAACPRCGSTNPGIRGRWVTDTNEMFVGDEVWEPCDDRWHDRPTEADHDGHTIDVGPVTVPPTGADDPQHNDDDDVMGLTAPEAACFAQRLLANHLADKDETDQWAAWGLVPELSEGSYRLLLEHLAALAGQALVRADNLDRELGIDSRDLIRRAT